MGHNAGARAQWVQPAERELEVRVAFSGGVGGMDAGVKPTRTYSRRPLAYATRTDPRATRAAGYTLAALLTMAPDSSHDDQPPTLSIVTFALEEFHPYPERSNPAPRV